MGGAAAAAGVGEAGRSRGGAANGGAVGGAAGATLASSGDRTESSLLEVSGIRVVLGGGVIGSRVVGGGGAGVAVVIFTDRLHNQL